MMTMTGMMTPLPHPGNKCRTSNSKMLFDCRDELCILFLSEILLRRGVEGTWLIPPLGVSVLRDNMAMEVGSQIAVDRVVDLVRPERLLKRRRDLRDVPRELGQRIAIESEELCLVRI